MLFLTNRWKSLGPSQRKIEYEYEIKKSSPCCFKAAVAEENAAGAEEASASVDEQNAVMAEITSASRELASIAGQLNTAISSKLQ